jgi:hypothetical protein
VLLEDVDYYWEGEDLVIQEYLLNPNSVIQVLEFEHPITRSIQRVPARKNSDELGEVLGKRVVVSDWNSLLDMIDECPYEIEIYDLPAQLMIGYRCRKNGDTWVIPIKNVRANGPKGMNDLEERAKIVTEHSAKIAGK